MEDKEKKAFIKKAEDIIKQAEQKFEADGYYRIDKNSKRNNSGSINRVLDRHMEERLKLFIQKEIKMSFMELKLHIDTVFHALVGIYIISQIVIFLVSLFF